jgi:hypothetical protein
MALLDELGGGVPDGTALLALSVPYPAPQAPAPQTPGRM